MAQTLKRRTKVREAALAAADTTDVKVYSLRNNFIGEVRRDIGTEYLTDLLDRYHFASLYRRDAATVVLRVHANEWYEWSA